MALPTSKESDKEAVDGIARATKAKTCYVIGMDLTVTLTPEHARRLDAEVAAGRDRAEAVARALTESFSTADDAEEIEYWKEYRFRELIETAEASLARGEGVVVDDVDAYFNARTQNLIRQASDCAA